MMRDLGRPNVTYTSFMVFFLHKNLVNELATASEMGVQWPLLL